MDINAFSDKDLQIFKGILVNLGVTNLHFDGDISNDFKNLSKPFLTELSDLFEVSYNLGNHDMVGLTENEISSSDFSVKWFGKTAFVSFHGWYDYSLMTGEIEPKKIEQFKQNFYFDRKIHREFDDIKTTALVLEDLKNCLTELSNAERIIVSTHFVPHERFIINTRYEKFARFNAYLGSRHFHELFVTFPNVSDVVFGHLHHRMMPQQIDGVTYHAKPLGYSYEWQMVSDFLNESPQFQIEQSWHLRKRYQAIKKLPEWQNFRQAHLADELRSALTIFELSSE